MVGVSRGLYGAENNMKIQKISPIIFIDGYMFGNNWIDVPDVLFACYYKGLITTSSTRLGSIKSMLELINNNEKGTVYFTVLLNEDEVGFYRRIKGKLMDFFLDLLQ